MMIPWKHFCMVLLFQMLCFVHGMQEFTAMPDPPSPVPVPLPAPALQPVIPTPAPDPGPTLRPIPTPTPIPSPPASTITPSPTFKTPSPQVSSSPTFGPPLPTSTPSPTNLSSPTTLPTFRPTAAPTLFPPGRTRPTVSPPPPPRVRNTGSPGGEVSSSPLLVRIDPPVLYSRAPPPSGRASSIDESIKAGAVPSKEDDFTFPGGTTENQDSNPDQSGSSGIITQTADIFDTATESPVSSFEPPLKFIRGRGNPPKSGKDDDDHGEEDTEAIDITSSEEALSHGSATFVSILKYISSVVAALSVILLMLFYFVSFEIPVVSLWSPNTWEFPLFISYLQHMASISQGSFPLLPSYLLEYTDAFAWSNFIFSSSSFTSDNVSSYYGIVAYARRNGIDESKLLFHSIVGFIVVIGILLLLAMILAWKKDKKFYRAALCTLGLCMVVWFMALYPLTMLASYEIFMQITAGQVANALIVAIVVLLVLCIGLFLLNTRLLYRKSLHELVTFETLAVWGSLYGSYTYSRRMFCIIICLIQIAMGLVIGILQTDLSQLIVMLIIQVFFIVAVSIWQPFGSTFVLKFAIGVGVAKVLNSGLAFRFLSSNQMSVALDDVAAQVYIWINTLLILLWFGRLLVILKSSIEYLRKKSGPNAGKMQLEEIDEASSMSSCYHQHTKLTTIPEYQALYTTWDDSCSSNSSSRSSRRTHSQVDATSVTCMDN